MTKKSKTAHKRPLKRVVSLRGKLKAWLTLYREYEEAKIEAVKLQDFQEACRCIKDRRDAADVVCKEMLKQANHD